MYNFINIKTETASVCTVCDIIETEGFAVRNETVLDWNSKDKISYKVDDSDKIEKGGLIADVYKNDNDERLNSELIRIDDEIKTLKKLRSVFKYDVRGPDELEKDINGAIRDIEDYANKKSYADIYDSRKKFMRLMNERRISLGKRDDFDQRIKYLEDKKNNIKKSISGSKSEINSPIDGYFVSSLDGYENAISYKDVKRADVYDINIDNIPYKEVSSNNVGKLVNPGDWYIICCLSKPDALRMKIGNTYELKLSSLSQPYMACKVIAIKNIDSENANVVISCNYLNKEICRFRKGHIKIKVNEYYGAKINKSAVCYKNPEAFIGDISFNDLLVGVNVKCGNLITFKKINIIYSTDSYVVCSLEVDYNKSSLFLRTGDQVVVEGTNLYDGKLIKC